MQRSPKLFLLVFFPTIVSSLGFEFWPFLHLVGFFLIRDTGVEKLLCTGMAPYFSLQYLSLLRTISTGLCEALCKVSEDARQAQTDRQTDQPTDRQMKRSWTHRHIEVQTYEQLHASLDQLARMVTASSTSTSLER